MEENIPFVDQPFRATPPVGAFRLNQVWFAVGKMGTNDSWRVLRNDRDAFDCIVKWMLVYYIELVSVDGVMQDEAREAGCVGTILWTVK